MNKDFENDIKSLLVPKSEREKKQVALFLPPYKIEELDELVKELAKFSNGQVNRNVLLEKAVDNLIKTLPSIIEEYELVPKLENQKTVATGYNMLAKERSFDIVTSEPVTVLKKKTESEQESRYEVSLNEEVKLPIEAGEQVGTLTYYYNGKAYKEVPLTVKETLEKNSFIGLLGYIVSQILFGENA